MTDGPAILLVDDDRDIRSLVARMLQENGFRTTALADGRALTKTVRDGRYDLVVLDLMLPGEDGLSLCRRLRAESDIPVIMLTARGDDTDRIVGLELGADDYLPKPFNPRELLARIRSVLRRSRAEPAAPGDVDPGETLQFAGRRLELGARTLYDADGVLVRLTSGEFDLLRALLERPGRVLSRDRLTDICRGPSADPPTRSVDILISRLRRKLEPDATTPQLIVTVRNAGYMLNAVVTRRGGAEAAS